MSNRARDTYPHLYEHTVVHSLRSSAQQARVALDEIDRLRAESNGRGLALTTALNDLARLRAEIRRDPADDLADLLDSIFGALGWVMGRGEGMGESTDWYVLADWRGGEENEYRIHVSSQTIRDTLRDALEAAK